MEGKPRTGLVLIFTLLLSPLPLYRALTLTVPLYRLDSLIFPDATAAQLLRYRLRRDSLRFKALTTTDATTTTTSALDQDTGPLLGTGEYYTRVSVGTPPTDVKLVIDTGSDLVWLKCSEKSQTLRHLTCYYDRQRCRGLREESTCRATNEHCTYNQSYGDGTWTEGDLSSETLTLRDKHSEGFILGCSLSEAENMTKIEGLLGLGRGKVSFPSQTMTQFNGIFSHCLTNNVSTLDFGGGLVPTNTTLFTPMMSDPMYYCVELTGISVGGTLVTGVNASLFRDRKGVIVDSGTTYTTLVEPAYAMVRDAFIAASRGLNLIPETGSDLETCFSASGDKQTPGMVLHFVNGADVELPPENLLVEEEGHWCFAFKGVENGPSIVGNTQLQRIRVVYDLTGSRVGFTPKAC